MKRYIKAIALSLILSVVSAPAFAQQADGFRHLTKQEILAQTPNTIQYTVSDFLPVTTLMTIFVGLGHGIGTSLSGNDQIKYDGASSGGFHTLGYSRVLKGSAWELGAGVSFAPVTNRFSDKDTHKVVRSESFYFGALMLNAKYNYAVRKNFRFYSRVGLGAGAQLGIELDEDEKFTVAPFFYYNPLCMRIGGQKFGVSFELGLGDTGLGTFGLDYRF